MFREMISPTFTGARACVTACGIMHPRCCRPVAWKRSSSASRLPAGFIPVRNTASCNTQSSAPEDRRNHRPKHVELIGVINKPLLLHLVGCLYYLYLYPSFYVYGSVHHNIFYEITNRCSYMQSILFRC
jgi:hypothetical protein